MSRLRYLALGAVIALASSVESLAQGNRGAGALNGALGTATEEIRGYMDGVQNIIYAIAGIVAIIGAFNVYTKMSNGDQDVKTAIMSWAGGIIFLLVVAQVIPTMFR